MKLSGARPVAEQIEEEMQTGFVEECVRCRKLLGLVEA